VLDALLEGGAATNIVGINGTPLDIAKRCVAIQAALPRISF